MKLRRAIGVLLAVVLALVFSTTRADATRSQPAPPTALVDTLAGAQPTDVFGFGASGGAQEGYSIGYDNQLAFEISLTRPMVITEIGGFVNCSIFGGCSAPAFAVDVRASIGGVPSGAVLGSFVLSDDGDPESTSFETASPRLVLSPGAYFVLLRMREAGLAEGSLLGNVYPNSCCIDPSYHAGFPPAFGAFDAGVYTPFADSRVGGAVRVLARPIPLNPSDCKDHDWRLYADHHGDSFGHQGPLRDSCQSPGPWLIRRCTQRTDHHADELASSRGGPDTVWKNQRR